MTMAMQKEAVRPARNEATSHDGLSVVRIHAQAEWQDGATMRTLGELCQKSVISVDPRREPDSEFVYVDISAIDNSSKRIVKPQRVMGKNASVRARQVIHARDVLVSTTRPNLNAVALVPAEHSGNLCSTGFCVLRCGEELDPDYLFAFVQSPMFVSALTELVQGALYPAVTDKQVFAQTVPWVPVEAQRRIAARLKTQLAAVEQARQTAQARACDIARLVSSILEAAFAATLDAPRIRLADLSRTTSGSTPSRDRKDYWEPAVYPWVRTAEVAFEPITITGESISERALHECSLSLLPVGTVLVAMYGQGKTRGQSAMLRVPATTNQACFAILPGELHDAQYLQFWLRRSYRALRELSDARGGNQSNLNGEILNDFEVPLIPLPQQQRIASDLKRQLAAIEQMRAASQAQLADIEALPARLLAQAFDPDHFADISKTVDERNGDHSEGMLDMVGIEPGGRG